MKCEAGSISELIAERYSADEKRELDERRAGKRRVFWRVRKPGGARDFTSKSLAFAYWSLVSRSEIGVTRVTVRPRGKQ